MSELDAIKNIGNMAPKKGPFSTIAAALIGASMGNKKGKKEYENEAKLAKYKTDLSEYSAQQSHVRDMQKSKQLANYKAQDSARAHNQGLEAKRFEADTVHEFASRYPHATDIQHGGTKVRFGKRSGSTPSKSKDTQPKAKAKKSGKGKTK